MLPFSALLARALLAEPLPRSFLPSLLLITAGLLLPQLAPMASSGPMDDPAGLFWALAAVLTFSAAALTGRRISAAGIPPVLSVGVGSLASALVFAVLAMLLYGPGHFLLLGEPLDAATLAGVLLLLAGVALARRRPAGLPRLGA